MAARFLSLARFPVILIVAVTLIASLWAGLVRMGWYLPGLAPTTVAGHGPLMISGVFGTLISLERAVALAASRGIRAGFGAPLLSGLGAVLLLAGAPLPVGKILMAAGSLIGVGVFLAVLRQGRPLYALVLALAVGAWLVGNLLWLFDWPVFRIVPWWMAFLVLTIIGERLELSRVARLSVTAERLFVAAIAAYLLALLLTLVASDAGTRLSGLAQVALALWLLRYDIARRTARRDGLTRYIGVCLLVGYLWLATGGVLALASGPLVAGPGYDAALHAILLGFVFSMIFGHMPIILPALTGRQVAYTALFYAPLALLHASLVVRLAGDFALRQDVRQWGGMLNAVAIVAFLGLTAARVIAARRAETRVV